MPFCGNAGSISIFRFRARRACKPSKIERIVEECKFGIHDLSAVALDATTNLPRFNMPLELGLFLGCKRFGAEAQGSKRCLILDSDPYRYRVFISDLSGQDIRSHNGEAERAIREVRDWLRSKAVANIASRRISEKQGMRLVGVEERDYVCGRLPAEIPPVLRSMPATARHTGASSKVGFASTIGVPRR
jgi:hypothetical protein